MIEQREYDYLQQTLHSLQQTRKHLCATIEHKNASFNDLQKYVVDFHAELDKFEIYDYQQSLRMIDKQGVANVLAKQQIDRLLDSPYFGGFDFIYEDETEAERFYIGRFGHEGENGQTLIYDWRAPICHMYYEFEIGAAYYEAMQQRFDGELIGKRQIKIEHGELQYVLNSSLTIQDEALQQVLHANGSDKMKTIVTSIQKEQNQIVRDDTAHTLIIQGVAGSGKTAVALHRIAYYLYKYRDTLRAERIFILSPNKVFGHYISNVLPELGEEPIRSFTLDELTERLLPNAVTYTSFEEETAFILENPQSA
ncbi:hypothetical protein [Caryophanon tenue]|uniref:Uncharacterized protein n=1 Tax=Caryophanon tenue TaxID=33978 RepID=A0A1C0YI25_9BACL|nr:hypothetical protein [Caryophanon tenue]OCS86784.1 hypothetical protein A6M13_12570 [Caryophanon tenue]